MYEVIKPVWHMRLIRAAANRFAAVVDRITAAHPRGSWRQDTSYDDPRVSAAYMDGYEFGKAEAS